MTKEEFIKVTDLLKRLFLKEKLEFTADAAEAWYECLKDIDYRRVNEGIKLYAKENQWMPSIAEIRKYASRIPKYTQEEINRMIDDAKEKERDQGDTFGF